MHFVLCFCISIVRSNESLYSFSILLKVLLHVHSVIVFSQCSSLLSIWYCRDSIFRSISLFEYVFSLGFDSERDMLVVSVFVVRSIGILPNYLLGFSFYMFLFVGGCGHCALAFSFFVLVIFTCTLFSIVAQNVQNFC